jgi:uncharacterized protein (DUF433 family)
MSTRRQALEGAVVWTGRCVCEDTRIWVVEVVVVVLAEEQTDSSTLSNLAKKSRGQVLAALSLAVKHLNPGSLASIARCFVLLLQHEPRAVSPS